MAITRLLILYCGMILLASLAGGWLPLVIRLTHRRMQIAISFVAGVMLGMGLLHLIPHSYYALDSIDTVVKWALGGFLGMFFLERFFHFHHHDAPDELMEAAGEVCHDPSHAPHSHAAEHAAAGSFSWTGAAVGLSLHSLVDGIALAAAVAAEHAHSEQLLWPGLGIFLAVLLHKPFDSLSIGALMAAAGCSRGQCHLINVLYALAVPLGVIVFYAGFSDLDEAFLGRALGFTAGAFICIATSDLLPELQFHSHDRGKLSVALLLGIALAWMVVYFEAAGHDHDHDHNDAPQQSAKK